VARAASSPASESPDGDSRKKPSGAAGRLYVVATPLGNLEDLTFRAVEVLRSVAFVACEDTRHSRKLLAHYGVVARVLSCHDHNEESSASQIAALLESGLDVALISDAGTPGISDPGYRAVSLAAARGLEVTPVPGPSALAAAVSVAGLPTDRFLFAGFLPPKTSAIKSTLQELAAMKATLVFYCPARRLETALNAVREVLGDRRAVICRELTKVHEQVSRGRLSDLSAKIERGEIPARGEAVLLLEGAERESFTDSGENLAQIVASILDDTPKAESLGAKQLTVLAAERLGAPRNRVYPLVCAWLNRRE
jgi:16S rRNA (cytidine1402-2'-O)-methyltransferase